MLSLFGNSFENYAICKEILQDLSLKPQTSPAQDSLARQTLLQAAMSAQQSSFWEEALGLCSDFIQQYPDATDVEAAQIYSTIGIANMSMGNMDIAIENHYRAVSY